MLQIKKIGVGLCLAASAWLGTAAQANIDIVFDYSLDTNGFFDLGTTFADGSTGVLRRQRLNEAASFYENAFQDTLSAITLTSTNPGKYFNPTTGNIDTVSGTLPIAENEIRVYVGGRNFGALAQAAAGWYSPYYTSWVEGPARRGQGDIWGNNAVDIAPWGGSIAFDTELSSTDYNWWWGSESEDIPARYSSSDPVYYDFLSVALHELGHMLGFSANHDVYNNQVDGPSNTFIGANAVAEHGSPVPLYSENTSHWSDQLDAALMKPALTNNTRVLVTPLDWAAFKDIGWEVVIPEPATFALLGLGFVAALGRRR